MTRTSEIIGDVVNQFDKRMKMMEMFLINVIPEVIIIIVFIVISYNNDNNNNDNNNKKLVLILISILILIGYSL